MTAAPRIALGVGATKAGTSWLYRWMAEHPECHMRRVKELHYFNSHASGTVPGRLAWLRNQQQLAAVNGAHPDRVHDLYDAAQLLEAPESKEAYVAYLMKGRTGERVVGEVTPAYALLPPEKIADIAGIGDTRLIYLMRDPVERLWSHVRMMANLRAKGAPMTPERCERILSRTFAGEETQIEIRCDYKSAISKLRDNVPEERLLILFTEELVTGEALPRLCAHLGVSAFPALDRVIFPGKPLDMTEAQRARARDYLDTQYSYVEKAMGYVPEAWKRKVAA